MELVNALTAAEPQIASGDVPDAVMSAILRDLVLLLAPFAPYLASELWETIGGKGDLLRAPWPVFDEALAREDEIEIPVQINGKLCTVIRVPADAGEDSLRDTALADVKVQDRIAGRKIVKVIIVPGKLVNLVVK